MMTKNIFDLKVCVKFYTDLVFKYKKEMGPIIFYYYHEHGNIKIEYYPEYIFSNEVYIFKTWQFGICK